MDIFGVAITSICSIAAAAIASIVSSRSQLQQSSINVYLDARLEAFQEYEAAIEAWSTEKTDENAAAVFHAVNNAALVSSDDTISAIGNVQELIYAYMNTHIMNVDDFHRTRAAALVAMRNDLLTYPMPKASDPFAKKIKRWLRRDKRHLQLRRQKEQHK